MTQIDVGATYILHGRKVKVLKIIILPGHPETVQVKDLEGGLVSNVLAKVFRQTAERVQSSKPKHRFGY